MALLNLYEFVCGSRTLRDPAISNPFGMDYHNVVGLRENPARGGAAEQNSKQVTAAE